MMKLLYDQIFLPLTKLINVQKAANKPRKKRKSNKNFLEPNQSLNKEETENLHKVVRSKMNDQMLGRKEAAEFLGVKENTLAIWKLTNRQIIPTYKVGKYIKYKASDLQQFIDNNLT